MNPPTNESKFIFVSGIHGVGKSSICVDVSKQAGLKHIVASDLIRSTGRKSDDGSKRVESIGQNQDALLHALRPFLNSGNHYLLDGHFALLNSEGVITDVPTSTFHSIAPIGIVFIYDEPNTIAQRLAARDQNRLDIPTLELLQARERSGAERVSHSLNIPLLITTTELARADLLEFASIQFLDQ